MFVKMLVFWRYSFSRYAVGHTYYLYIVEVLCMLLHCLSTLKRTLQKSPVSQTLGFHGLVFKKVWGIQRGGGFPDIE